MTPRLPPGQIETKRFPVVGERAPSPDLTEAGDWHLTVSGLVANPIQLDYETYMGLEHRDITFDVHCVTSWTRFDTTFSGVPLARLLEDAAPAGRAKFVSFSAFSSRDHHTSLPIEVATASSWLVHASEGEPLEMRHGGPVRVVTPGRYFYKSLKWVKSIELLEHDRLGWWESESSYHNNGDPWAGNERFTTGSLRPEQLERFLGAASYDKYRGRVMLGLDLRSWKPVTSDLRRLYLKNCDLRHVDLAGADLIGANLSLSDLSGANLSGADLSGADLEGADFTNADLRNADLSGTALSATRFDGASVDGARFVDVWGLLEGQHRYLVERGVELEP